MVNYWAVIVAGVIMFAIGAVWYTALFGQQWRALMGVPEGSPQEGLVPGLIVGFIANLLEAYALARVLAYAGPADLMTGILIGTLVWVGFVAAIMVPTIFYERKPPMLVVINGAYQLVGLVVMGAILGWWR